MEINRNNYEEFFLLYVDGELDVNELTAVEKFMEQNPDLKQELEALIQTRLSIDDSLAFDKAQLYKSTSDIINSDNYQEYLLNDVDNELTAEEKNLLAVFVQNNPGKEAEVELLKRVKLDADERIIFSDKADLYRKEKEKVRLIPLYWKQIAAAAVVIIIGTLIWFTNSDNKQETQKVLANIETNGSRQNKQGKETEQSESDKAEVEPGIATVTDKIKSAEVTNEVQLQTKKSSDDNKRTASIVEKNIETPSTEKSETVINVANTPVDDQSMAHENTAKINQKISSTPAPVSLPAVKPVIIDQAAFNGDKDVAASNGDNADNITPSLEPDDNSKKSKGKFRGLFRKASRLIDRVTNADPEENHSIVRVASFEIAKK